MSQLTIRHLLINSFQQFADLDALSYVDSPAISYRELYQKVFTLSLQLKGIGITKGDKIAILSGNGPNWGISYLATVCMGAVVVPILNDFSKNEIQNILNHSETKVLFISKNLLHKMGNEGYEFVKHIISIEDFSANTSFESFASSFPSPSNIDFSTADIDELFGTLEDDALASIIYTSGTTGQSKGVMLSHKNLMSNMQNTSRIQPITPNDRMLSVLPLSHTYECTLGFLLPLSLGGQIFYFKGAPVPSVLLPALKTIRPTMMLTVPLIIEKIYRNKIQPVVSKGLMKYLFHFPPTRKAFSYMVGLKLKKTFGNQLHFFGIGGALLDAKVELFLKEAKFPYEIGYGLTETSPLLAGSPGGKRRYRSTGPSVPGQELKIINVNPKTGEGEIIAKGDNVMKGYYKNEELTKTCFTKDGWFKTGDLGVFDKQMRLYIKGRLKNMILRANGENIYPEEIEAVVNRHKLVVESIVYEMKGKLIAKVNLDYEEIEKRFNNMKEAAQLFQNDIQQYIKKILDDIKTYVNNEVSNSSKLVLVLEQPDPFIKTPTMKIKKYLYV